jgi:hypothetical protein
MPLFLLCEYTTNYWQFATKKKALIRNGKCWHPHCGLFRLQNCEKQMSAVSKPLGHRSSNPLRYLPKAPTPNSITLGLSTSTYSGHIIQSISKFKKILYQTWTMVLMNVSLRGPYIKAWSIIWYGGIGRCSGPLINGAF